MGETEERRIYIFGVIFAIVFVLASITVLTLPVSAKNASYGRSDGEAKECSAEPAETDLRAVFDENSAMPCVDRESFEKWMETYEQETSEEETEKPNINTDCREDVQTGIPTELPTEVETSVEVPSDPVEETVEVYSVDGITPDPELQRMLYEALDRHSISYFYEIAWVQCYQESKWNVYAVNPNNLIDSGVLQYRATYWDWTRGDLFSPQAQFDLYAEQMSARLNQGLSADECISRHKTSDWVEAVDWQYVAEVKQHLTSLRKVEM